MGSGGGVPGSCGLASGRLPCAAANPEQGPTTATTRARSGDPDPAGCRHGTAPAAHAVLALAQRDCSQRTRLDGPRSPTGPRRRCRNGAARGRRELARLVPPPGRIGRRAARLAAAAVGCYARAALRSIHRPNPEWSPASRSSPRLSSSWSSSCSSSSAYDVPEAPSRGLRTPGWPRSPTPCSVRLQEASASWCFLPTSSTRRRRVTSTCS